MLVQYQNNGEPVEETKVASLTVGGNASLAFGEVSVLQQVAKPVETKLTVRVPAKAKVFLSGYETQQVGAVREFTTRKLSAGQIWSNYTIRVELEKDGKAVVKEETISLTAGETRELAFNFNEKVETIAQLVR